MFAAFTLVFLFAESPITRAINPNRRAMVAIGATAERVHHGPLMVFIFLWSTLVYDPIARWTWNPHGWSFDLGGLDFAGGTPVHITSGATALALSWYLGIRKGVNIRGHNYRPNNISYIYLGTAMMWFGWLGFNGGSALSANFKAAQSIIVTNIAASAGGLTYLLLV
jgi:Amt family ammonium transporter